MIKEMNQDGCLDADLEEAIYEKFAWTSGTTEIFKRWYGGSSKSAWCWINYVNNDSIQARCNKTGPKKVLIPLGKRSFVSCMKSSLRVSVIIFSSCSFVVFFKSRKWPADFINRIINKTKDIEQKERQTCVIVCTIMIVDFCIHVELFVALPRRIQGWCPIM